MNLSRSEIGRGHLSRHRWRHRRVPLVIGLLLSRIVVSCVADPHQRARVDVSQEYSGMRTAHDMSSKIAVVFSDVDGTLVHYDDDNASNLASSEEGNQILQLPPSATGMRGVISSRTLRQCSEIRRRGTKLVLVSGMRTTTLLNRLPFLPKADVYCSEGGGRIFVAVRGTEYEPAVFDGATGDDLLPFGLKEDDAWREKMSKEDAAGPDGYPSGLGLSDSDEGPPSISQRRGLLWSHARALEARGFVLDDRGYSTCFRVNRKHQDDQHGSDAYDALAREVPPVGLATSTNLGCIDFYPEDSGKKNSCLYIAGLFCGSSDRLASDCVCLCDDDNDIAMALACSHAYLPALSADSLASLTRSEPEHFTVAAKDVQKTTKATEQVLEKILDQLH